MRLYYPLALVSSTAILTRNADSSSVPDSSMTEANFPVSVRFSAGHHKGALVKRLLREHEPTTSGEERAPSPKQGPISESIRENIAALVTTLHSHDTFLEKVAGFTKEHLQSTDVLTTERYLTRLREEPGGPPPTSTRVRQYVQWALEKLNETPASRNEMMKSIQESVRAHEQERVVETEAKRAEWLRVKRNPHDVFTELCIAEATDDVGRQRPFASPDLGVLTTYIEQFNAQEGTTIALLDTFITGFGGEDKLVRLLSREKLSPINRPQAQNMQWELMRRWANGHMTPDDVAKMLGLSLEKENVLTYENLDPIATYVSICNKVRPGEQPDTFTYLKARFRNLDREQLTGYVKMVVDASHQTVLAEKPMQTWMEQDMMSERLHHAIAASASPNADVGRLAVAQLEMFHAANQAAAQRHRFFITFFLISCPQATDTTSTWHLLMSPPHPQMQNARFRPRQFSREGEITLFGKTFCCGSTETRVGAGAD